MSTPTPPVIAVREGAVGHLTLNRPRAINALTLEMVRLIDTALTLWERDGSVQYVLLDGAGERGFCAGGDIVVCADAARTRELGPAQDFWREEYRLNAHIARYPKPIVAIMNGVVMGGGIGLASHASHRIATPGLIAAMPEVGIGFSPDVGGTYLLSRAPGELGAHFALTAGRMNAADALVMGLADRVIEGDAVPALAEAMAEGAPLEATLSAAPAATPEPSALPAARTWIDAAYAGDDAGAILAALSARTEPEAQAAAEAMGSKSPTSLKVTLRALREARARPSLESCLDGEYRIALGFLDTPDFIEGVRAALVDKDRQPHWNPASINGVPDAATDRFFAPLDGVPELGLAR
jgi:enoyl-CoA hydratase